MKVVKIFVAFLVLGVFLAAGAGIGLYYWAQEDLPGFTKLSDYSPALATTVATSATSTAWESEAGLFA